MASCVDELQVHQKALAAADAISAITDCCGRAGGWEIQRQLRAAAGRVPAHIAEGFGQKTDRHFAHYLYIARGTTKEIRAHLSVAQRRLHITDAERSPHADRYDEIARMLTGLIRHLEREDRTSRG